MTTLMLLMMMLTATTVMLTTTPPPPTPHTTTAAGWHKPTRTGRTARMLAPLTAPRTADPTRTGRPATDTTPRTAPDQPTRRPDPATADPTTASTTYFAVDGLPHGRTHRERADWRHAALRAATAAAATQNWPFGYDGPVTVIATVYDDTATALPAGARPWPLPAAATEITILLTEAWNSYPRRGILASDTGIARLEITREPADDIATAGIAIAVLQTPAGNDDEQPTR